MQEKPAQASIQAEFDAAIGFHQSGNLVDAEKHYHKVLALDPRHPDAIHYLGVIAHQAGKSEIAVAMIRAAIQINSQDASYFANLALALNATHRFDEALVACEQAISRNPGATDAYLSRATALSAFGRLDEAAAVLAGAVQIAPAFGKARFQLGLLRRSQGKTSEALNEFDAAIRIAPSNAQAHFCRAAVLDEPGRFAESVDAYSMALHLQPDYASAHCNLGGVLFKLARFDGAVACSRRLNIVHRSIFGRRQHTWTSFRGKCQCAYSDSDLRQLGRGRKWTGHEDCKSQKRKRQPEGWRFSLILGGPGRNRTTDTRIFNPLLYRLSYQAKTRDYIRVGANCKIALRIIICRGL